MGLRAARAARATWRSGGSGPSRSRASRVNFASMLLRDGLVLPALSGVLGRGSWATTRAAGGLVTGGLLPVGRLTARPVHPYIGTRPRPPTPSASRAPQRL